MDLDKLRKFVYIENDEVLRWHERTSDMFKNKSVGLCDLWNRKYSHKFALHKLNHDGYRVGNICGFGDCRQHRVIYMLYHNKLIKDGNIIDHIDRNRANNHISNLREISIALNQKNRSISSNNTSGYSGVSKRSRKDVTVWRAQINIDRKKVHLGWFKDIEDAIAARKEAEIKYGYEGD